ncbi:MAG: hypothetical protein AB7P37_21060 [Ramlibacter sp.]
MKHIPHVLALLALAALSACTTTQGPPVGGGYKPGESAPARISEAEAETLTAQYLDLKNQRTTLVNAMATTSDPATRTRFSQSIDILNRDMQPLEYRLRSAGRPIP